MYVLTCANVGCTLCIVWPMLTWHSPQDT